MELIDDLIYNNKNDSNAYIFHITPHKCKANSGALAMLIGRTSPVSYGNLRGISS